jgi:hypothetical protein
MPTPTLPISTLSTANTFRAWLERTNTIIDLINSGAIVISAAANGAAIGAFAIGNTVDTTSSLTIAGGKLLSNATGTFLTGTATFGANLTVNASAANVVFSSNATYLLSNTTFIGGANLTVNTAVTVNGSFTLTPATTFTVGNNATFSSNISVSNNIIASNTIYARSIVFNSASSVVAATLSSAAYNDYTVAGLIDAITLNINPDTQDISITGIAAPSNMSAGARVLYLQNTNATYKITLRNANTSSSSGNRIATGGGDIDVPPLGAIPLLYSFTTSTWRPLAAPSGSASTLTVTGNASVGGALSVTGNTVLTSNVAIDTNVLFVDTVNNRVGINIIPLHPFHVSGNGVIANNMTVGQTLAVTGATTLSNTLSITGATNALSTLGVTGILSALGGLSVTGAANVSTTLLVGTTLTVNGATSMNGAVNVLTTFGVTGAANALGTFGISGAANALSTFGITGAANALSTLGITGAVNALSTLGVTGATTLSGTLLTNGVATVNANSTVNGSMKFTGTSARLVVPVGSNLWAT